MTTLSNAARLATNLATLRQYLQLKFYPDIFSRPPDIADDDDTWLISPVDRALRLHDEFVTFCGERQADWYSIYIQELRAFFAACGETDLIVQLTLREEPVMRHLRRFCQ
ncbi:hypothetical protein A6C57_01000 [Fibrella sp. ES10-3-2-2]|nr:hypothetical protein A6C57_01000 [Fibrella sp. ES10-3-2-2]